MNNIKFSFYSGMREMLIDGRAQEMIDFLHSAEVDSIELLEIFGAPPMFKNTDEARELSSLLASEGIFVCCYAAYIDVFENFASAEPFLKEQIDIACALGSPYLLHTLKPALEPCDNSAGADFIPSEIFILLKNISEYAEKCGIKMLYEPQGICFNGDGFKRLITELRERGVDNVFACLDMGNPMFVDHGADELINEMFPLIRHVHIKDYKLCERGKGDYTSISGRSFYEVGYAQGDMKNAECISALVKSGYSGYFSTELNPTGISSHLAGREAVESIRKQLGST